MPFTSDPVTAHYGRPDLLDAIDAALRAAGKDPDRLTPPDLAPVDEFHLRGREATLELARLAQPAHGERAVDVGCSLGGSARHLAHAHGCRVTGVDLTPEYIQLARTLTRRVGLDATVDFRVANALELPFADAAFDLAWTEHVQMNIADKRAFYGEIARVLAPGGRLVCHDILAGAGGAAHFPVPWAEDAAISHLVEAQPLRELLAEAGLKIAHCEDKTAQTLAWLEGRLAQPAPALGLHLLTGPSFRLKFENVARNLREGRIVVVQILGRKPA